MQNINVPVVYSELLCDVICATVGKRVGCGFKYGGLGRVCKIRPVQDSALSDHFNPLDNYQAKSPTC